MSKQVLFSLQGSLFDFEWRHSLAKIQIDEFTRIKNKHIINASIMRTPFNHQDVYLKLTFGFAHQNKKVPFSSQDSSFALERRHRLTKLRARNPLYPDEKSLGSEWLGRVTLLPPPSGEFHSRKFQEHVSPEKNKHSCYVSALFAIRGGVNRRDVVQVPS